MQQLTIAAASGSDKYDIKVSTELVRTPESVKVIGFHAKTDENSAADIDDVHRIAAVTDAGGQAMLLSLSGTNELFLIFRDAAAKGGFRQRSLSAGFKKQVGGAPWVQSFAIRQDDSKNLTVIVAASTDQTSPSHLFMVTGLSPKQLAQGPDWRYLGKRDDFAVSRFEMTRSSDGTTIWCGVAPKDRKGGGKRWSNIYGIDAEAADLADDPSTAWPKADVYPLVVDAELLDFDGGFDPDYGPGIYSLLRRSDQRSQVQFTSLPIKARRSDPVGKSRTRTWLNIDGKYRSITALDNGESSDLYLAGDNVALLSAESLAASSDAAAKLTPAPLFTDGPYSEVLPRVDKSGSINCFALADDGLLQTRRTEKGGAWTPTASLRKNVMQIAPTTDPERGGAAVYAGYLGGRLSKLVRRENIGTWSEEDVAVQDTGTFAEREAYLTRIVVHDAKGAPLREGAVNVRASSWCHAKLNGQERILDPHVDRMTDATLDGRGGLTVRVPAFGVSPPLIRIEIDALAEGLDIDPSAAIKSAAQGLSSDGLLEAQNGQNPLMRASSASPGPVIKGSLRESGSRGTLDAISVGLSNLSNLDSRAGVRSAKKGGTIDNKVAPPKSAGTWGVTIAKGKPTALSPARAKEITSGKVVAGPLEVLEGLWNDIENFVEDAVEIVVDVVDDVVRFVVKVADKVGAFLLNTLEEVGRAFEWLWAQIKVGISALVDWIGFVFDWPDIVRVRDYVMDSCVATIDAGRATVVKFRDEAAAWFDKVQGALAIFADLPADARTAKLNTDQANARSSETGNSDRVSEALAAMTNNPALEWVLEQVQDFIATYVVKLNLDAITKEVVATFTKFVDDIKTGVLNVVTDLNDFVDKLTSLLSKGDVSIEAVAKLFVGETGILLVDAARTFVVSGLDAVEGLLGVLEAVVTQEMEFPLLSKLFGEKVSTSLLKVLATFIAAPATVFYKLVSGKAPIAKNEKLPLLVPASAGSKDFTFVGQSGDDGIAKASRILGWVGVIALTIGTAWDDIERVVASKAGDAEAAAGPVAELAVAGRATIKLAEIVGEIPLTGGSSLGWRAGFWTVEWLELGWPFVKMKGASLSPGKEQQKINQAGSIIGLALKALLAVPIVAYDLKDEIDNPPDDTGKYVGETADIVVKFIQQEAKEIGGIVATVGALTNQPRVLAVGAIVEAASVAIVVGRLVASEAMGETFTWL